MNAILDALHHQHTTRRNEFTERTIEPEKIEAIKAAVLKTANASNRQAYSVIVLDTAHASVLDLPGSVVFLLCADFHRLRRCAEALGRELDSRYWMQFVTALADIGMLAQSCVLAAQSLGLSTLVTNQAYHGKLDRTYTLLGLPEKDVFPLLAVCMGYAAVEHGHGHGRLGPAQIFHSNIYHEPDAGEIEALIARYDEPDMGLIGDWAEKGYMHYLDWFFEKWCPAVGSRKQGEQMADALKEHGMIE